MNTPASLALMAAVVVATACGDTGGDASPAQQVPAATVTQSPTAETLFPDVIDAELASASDGLFTVAATISSPYDSPARYADAFRVLTPDGLELTVRVLTHDHASEQPFTRVSSPFAIPDGVTTLTIEGRDQISSWGGATAMIAVP